MRSKPTRPSQGTAGRTEGDAGDGTPRADVDKSILLDGELELRRPTPPKLAKRGKGWEEEEEEQETAKTAKVGTKTKRR
ncbi:MAG: hypothetical protein HC881_23675, partial [Leptolyngbyaceae cyanobacterium SL_7_1]|nr:hypothetical protein [Leptolyngbyaceae cyanobacterium SL_7_1]